MHAVQAVVCTLQVANRCCGTHAAALATFIFLRWLAPAPVDLSQTPLPSPLHLQARHEMARLMGFPSYSEYQLDSFSLAGHPAAVGIFLERLADAIAPKAAAEAQELGELKRRLLGGSSLQPWDKQYLVAAAEAGAGGSSGGSSGELGRHPAPQPTFQLEAVVEGLSELLRRSMGVSLQERPLGKGGWLRG